MCGAFYPNYFLKGSVDEESALREMSGNDPLNTVMVKLQGSITSLEEISILNWMKWYVFCMKILWDAFTFKRLFVRWKVYQPIRDCFTSKCWKISSGMLGLIQRLLLRKQGTNSLFKRYRYVSYIPFYFTSFNIIICWQI